jgi:hypothetical protein
MSIIIKASHQHEVIRLLLRTATWRTQKLRSIMIFQDIYNPTSKDQEITKGCLKKCRSAVLGRRLLGFGIGVGGKNGERL